MKYYAIFYSIYCNIYIPCEVLRDLSYILSRLWISIFRFLRFNSRMIWNLSQCSFQFTQAWNIAACVTVLTPKNFYIKTKIYSMQHVKSSGRKYIEFNAKSNILVLRGTGCLARHFYKLQFLSLKNAFSICTMYFVICIWF